MAFLGNYPFALAPGMGLNAYFTYTVCLGMGVPFQTVLLAVFCEGLIFILLSVTNVREAIFNAIPMTLKYAVSVGIGLFIAFIGLQGADLIINDDSTLITYQKFGAETFHTAGISAIFSAVDKIGGYEVDSIFKKEDLPEYHTYKYTECPFCKNGHRIEALVNSFGYSVL